MLRSFPMKGIKFLLCLNMCTKVLFLYSDGCDQLQVTVRDRRFLTFSCHVWKVSLSSTLLLRVFKCIRSHQTLIDELSFGEILVVLLVVNLILSAPF